MDSGAWLLTAGPIPQEMVVKASNGAEEYFGGSRNGSRLLWPDLSGGSGRSLSPFPTLPSHSLTLNLVLSLASPPVCDAGDLAQGAVQPDPPWRADSFVSGVG